MDKYNLTLYIEKIYELETSLYSQKKIRQNMLDRIYNIQTMEYQKYNNTSVDGVVERIANAFFASLFFLIPGYIFGFLIFFTTHFTTYTNYTVSKILMKSFSYDWKITIIFFMVILVVQIKSYLEDSKKIKNNISDNEKIKKYNNYVDYNKKEILPIYNTQLREINELYSNTENVLKNYYSKNIVYEKYQNLIAISSFYEYLKSGICSELGGHEGCYNKFDTEIRLNMIIGKLDQVIDKLDQIEENQRMLYEAIQTANNQSKRIGNQMDQLIKENRNHNIKLDYIAEKNANNIADIKWLETVNFFMK